jgi:hypothetical protein
MNSKGRVNRIPLAVSIAMLLASGGDWPYGFYQLLRIVVTGTAIYVVVQTLNHRQYWSWLMGGIAILFNPILPITLKKEEWQPIDFGVAIVFLTVLIQSLRRHRPDRVEDSQAARSLKRIEQNWVQHPVVAAIAQIGGLGLYTIVALLVVISLLELVDARNERVWWLTLTVGRLAAVAWAASWVIVLGVEAVNWLVRKVNR